MVLRCEQLKKSQKHRKLSEGLDRSAIPDLQNFESTFYLFFIDESTLDPRQQTADAELIHVFLGVNMRKTAEFRHNCGNIKEWDICVISYNSYHYHFG